MLKELQYHLHLKEPKFHIMIFVPWKRVFLLIPALFFQMRNDMLSRNITRIFSEQLRELPDSCLMTRSKTSRLTPFISLKTTKGSISLLIPPLSGILGPLRLKGLRRLRKLGNFLSILKNLTLKSFWNQPSILFMVIP